MLSNSGGCPRCMLVSFIFALIDCLSWIHWKNCCFSMPYISVSCWNVNMVLWLKMWWRCVMPFSFHLVPVRGDLFAVKSGLFHMSVWVVGENVVFFILFTLHQAVRVVAIAVFLKQWWCLIASLINGRSLIDMSWHTVCSISSHGWWWGVVWIHLVRYCNWFAK